MNNKKKIVFYSSVFCTVMFALSFLSTHSFSWEDIGRSYSYEHRTITTVHVRKNPIGVRFNDEFYKNFGDHFSNKKHNINVMVVDRKRIERIITMFLNIVEYKKTGLYIRVWDNNEEEEIHEINLDHLNFWSKWKVRLLFFV